MERVVFMNNVDLFDSCPKCDKLRLLVPKGKIAKCLRCGKVYRGPYPKNLDKMLKRHKLW